MKHRFPIPTTTHGRRRLHSRGISQVAVDAALAWGRLEHSHGAERYRVNRRSVAEARDHGVDISRHLGVTVVISRELELITAYKNRSPRRWRR